MDYLPYLSATQIGMFLRCARQWAFRYIEKLIIPPSGAMKQSGVFHTTAERNYLAKIESHTDLPMDDLTDFYRDLFDAEFKREEVRLDEGQTEGALKDQGILLVKTFRAGIAPKVQPVKVEHKFDVRLGKDEESFVLTGRIDLVDDKGRIRDNKALAPNRVPNAFTLATDIQLSTYSLAHRMETREVEPELTIDAIVKYKSPESRVLPTKRSRETLRLHLNTIGNIAKAIRADAFPRNPTGWWCSPKWCGYWDRCMGRDLLMVDLSENLEPKLKESVEREEKAQEESRQQARGEQEEAGQEEEQAQAADDGQPVDGGHGPGTTGRLFN